MSLKKQFSKSKSICKVTFSLPKEAVNGGKKVLLLGDFNNWDISKGIKMKAGKSGFTATLELATGNEYEFRYLIDKMNWTNDWDADAYRPSPYYGIENSVVYIGGKEKEEKQSKVKSGVAKKSAPKKKNSTKKATAKKEVTKKLSPKKKTSAKKPSVKKEVAKKIIVRKAKPDDLTKIEGVGPKISGLLKKGGFSTFEAVSKAKKTELKAILEKAGSRYQMHNPTTWPKQAKLAAQGKWTQLKTLQDNLKGGK